MLSFQNGNAKLGRGVFTFSLPAGFTCPGALKCLAKAVTTNGKTRVVDGPEQEFRCFAASDEARFPATRAARWRNHRALEISFEANGMLGMTNLLLAYLPAKARIVRVHVSGDFYRPEYLRAWLEVARQRPTVLFYAYTKSVSLVMMEKQNGNIPSNFRVTLSVGGRQDHLIAKAGIRTARVFLTEDGARAAGLESDHDDTHAQGTGGDFALVIHGSQKAGSAAAKAVSANRKIGFSGYGRKSA